VAEAIASLAVEAVAGTASVAEVEVVALAAEAATSVAVEAIQAAGTPAVAVITTKMEQSAKTNLETAGRVFPTLADQKQRCPIGNHQHSA
jgi:hypothetical protein